VIYRPWIAVIFMAITKLQSLSLVVPIKLTLGDNRLVFVAAQNR